MKDKSEPTRRPLVVVTRSGVIHISDRDGDESSLDYKCRCGRTLGFRGNDLHGETMFSSVDKDPSEYFQRGDHTRERSRFFQGGPKLCSKCGTPEEFDAAVTEYREGHRRIREASAEEARRRHEARVELVAEAGQILEKLKSNELWDFRSTIENGVLKLSIGEFEVEVKIVNIDELVDSRIQEEPSTECAGGHGPVH